MSGDRSGQSRGRASVTITTRRCRSLCSRQCGRNSPGKLAIAVLYLVLVLGISGCKSLSAQPEIELAGLVLINDTTQKISNIELSVFTTGELVRCAYIPSQQRFSTTFPVRRYRRQPVKITSNDQNQVWTAGPLVIAASDEVTAKTPARVRVVLGRRGRLHAAIVAESSLRDHRGRSSPDHQGNPGP